MTEHATPPAVVMADDPTRRALRTSPTIGAIAAALARAQAAYVPVRKDKTARIETKSGGSFSYDYVDLASLQAAIRPALTTNEIAYTQAVRVRAHVVTVETVLLHASGEWLSAELDLAIADMGDARAVGSSVTYARRFGLAALAGIAPADEDDDGAAAAATPPKTRRSSARPEPKTSVTAGTNRDAASPATPESPRRAATPGALSQAQRRLLFATATDHGWAQHELREEIARAFGVTSTSELHREDFDQLLNLLQRRPKVPTHRETAAREPGEEG
jgi:hypothetical protein